MTIAQLVTIGAIAMAYFVAMCLPQSPMTANGINDVIDVNGAIGNISDSLVKW